MSNIFRKISRIGRLSGPTKWYLSEDCLLAAKQMMYSVEYRRFYLRDLESIVVWPSRTWLLRPIIPGVFLIGLGSLLWHWVNFTAGAIVGGTGLAWMTLELALGPTAESRIRTMGTAVDLPLVKRTRRAGKVLAKIDAAVRTNRVSVVERTTTPAVSPQPAEPAAQSSSETASALSPIEDLT